MKKILLISALLIASVGVAYGSSGRGCDGPSALLTNIDLDESRTHEVTQLLKSYKHVKDLAMSGRHDEIPTFIEQTNEQLSQLLSDEEFAQFKLNIAGWSEGRDYSKFKGWADKAQK